MYKKGVCDILSKLRLSIGDNVMHNYHRVCLYWPRSSWESNAFCTIQFIDADTSTRVVSDRCQT
jgi:hypothetical protein